MQCHMSNLFNKKKKEIASSCLPFPSWPPFPQDPAPLLTTSTERVCCSAGSFSSASKYPKVSFFLKPFFDHLSLLCIVQSLISASHLSHRLFTLPHCPFMSQPTGFCLYQTALHKVPKDLLISKATRHFPSFILLEPSATSIFQWTRMESNQLRVRKEREASERNRLLNPFSRVCHIQVILPLRQRCK